MATPYSSVFGSFLQKVKNYSFASLSSDDIDVILHDYLSSAIPRFQYQCIKDLEQRDDALKQFNVDLFSDEIEILSTLMVLEYLKSKIYVDELLKQGFTNREWSRTSQANHLDELIKLKDATDKDVENMIIRYSYGHANFGDLK